jgi:hypothetical protein
MGIRHGSNCLGCCWALMAVLFVVGTMHVVWMAAIAGFVLVEKLAPRSARVSHAAAAVLVSSGAWILLSARSWTGDVRGGPGVTVGPMPVVSPDQLGTPSLLEPVQAFRWFIDHGARHGTGWVNRVTRVLPNTPVPFSPLLCAPFVIPPTLMMVAPEDEMAHADYAVARHTYELMPDPKEWYEIAGGHFGLLSPPSALFDEATGIQTEFLNRRLS